MDTLAIGMSWEVGSALEYPSQGTHSMNGDINLTLTTGEAGSRAHNTHKLIFGALSPQGQLR
jgi:hypothetical protein